MPHYKQFVGLKPAIARVHRITRAISTLCSPRVLFTGARIAALLSMCALIASVLALHGVPKASAIQAQPPTDWSFYMYSDSTSEAYTLGCNQGASDLAHSATSEVVLDFGGQVSNLGGAEMINGVIISNSHMAFAAEAFSHGYVACSGAEGSLALGLGTNNDIAVSTSAGQVWAEVVSAVVSSNSAAGYASKVVVGGANDIEPGFGGAAAARAWAAGFSAHISAFYLDFGSADGCPQSLLSGGATGSCNNGWTQEDEWYVSWGNPAALPTPEIYNTAQAHQWAALSQYSQWNHSDGRIQIQGPWDERDLDTSTLTPAQAWADLWNDLNASSLSAQNMSFSLEIHGEP